MKINSINKTSFEANLIKTITIQKLMPQTKTYYPAKVSFVEIESDNPKDTKALYEAANFWIDEKYANNIAYTSSLLNTKRLDKNKNKIYAITSQNTNFKELDENKILAMAEIEAADKPIIELSHIQVKPEIIYAIEKPEYKHIGTGMLNALKSLYSGIKLTAADSQSVINFYLKNKFSRLEPNSNKFLWKK